MPAGNQAGVMTAIPAVRAKAMHKRYGDLEVIKGLDLEIAQGETFALLGPNGAGKSTTVEILEGFRHRSSGAVEVLGVDPEQGDREWRSRLGIVLQDLPEREVMRSFTVCEQVSEQARYYRQARSANEVIELVGLGVKANARIGTLSGGQRRRLDVALAIVGRPELLFLDEPTTGFDPEARREFWTLIRALARGGTTIVLTTHYLEEAEQLADRVGILVDGVLGEIGAPASIGGTENRTPVVTWTDATGRHERRTEEPARLVAALRDECGGEPRELQVRRPSLEDVYLDLLNRHLARVEVAAAEPTSGEHRNSVEESELTVGVTA
jgi:ABC-2 type transport system ATP-binding protein